MTDYNALYRNALKEHRRRIANAENQRIEGARFVMNEISTLPTETKKQWNKMLDLKKKMIKYQCY